MKKIKNYRYKHVEWVELFDGVLIAKKTGTLNDKTVDIITDMTERAADDFDKQNERLKISKQEKNEMIQNTLDIIFEQKKWEYFNPNKVGGDKYRKTFAYFMKIITSNIDKYIVRLPRKRIYERERVS